MIPDHVAIATWYIETTQSLADLKREVDDAKRLGTSDRDGKMLRLAAGQIGRAQRFNELVTTPETARKVIAELILKLAIDTSSVAQAAFALDQSGNVSAGIRLMLRHQMIIPDDNLAFALAKAAEEQVMASGWSPADGLGEEIEATIAEIAEKYNVSLLVRSLADAIVSRETAQRDG
jgi:hypothetical protein